MRSRADRRARGIGFLLGAGLAIIAVLSWQIPRGHSTLGAAVTIASRPSGELGVSPSGTFINTIALKPGPTSAAVQGKVQIENQTGQTLDVQVRGVASTPDLNAALMVDVTSGGSSIFHGSLGEFRSWTADSISVGSGRSAGLQVSTWLPPTLTAGYQGRTATVDLQFKSLPETTR
jgi:hypothetical protein